MPDTTAHHYFGQQVFKALPADVQALLSAHKSVFDLGLQGPDLLFYYKPFLNNQIRELGVQIHWHSARGRMAAAAARLRERPDDAALCYLLGYACHHALDSAFHGDIARLASSGTEHFQLEAELDRQVIAAHYAQDPVAFRRWELVRVDTPDCGWLRVVYPELTARQAGECASSVVRYMFLLNAQSPLRLVASAIVERIAGKPGLFRAMMVPRQPNPRYEAAAGQFHARLEGVVPNGVRAVGEVFACVRDGGELSGLFEPNFE